MTRSRKAFTLVELIMAVTLMLILTGSIAYIFYTSRQLFSDGEQAVFILQNIRNANEIMAQDFIAAKRTHDMEFWDDSGEPPNGHFDRNETIVNGQLDFPGVARESRGYNAAMTIIASTYKDPKYEQDREDPLRCDAVYFRTTAMIDKELRDCLIAYMLEVKPPPAEEPEIKSLQPREPDRPVLKKYTVYRDQTGMYKVKEEDLCSYVQSFKIEYWFNDPYDGVAREWRSLKNGRYIEFAYKGTGELKQNGQFQVEQINDDIGTGATPDKMSQIGEGDRIYLYHDPTEQWPAAFNKDYAIETIDRKKDAPLTITFKPGVAPPIPMTNVSFRAGYLPPALQIRMQVTDEKRRQVRTFEAIYKLGGK